MNPVAPVLQEQVPVTILTGFLGSGKTTLLNHILRADHGHRIAVIENEFGEAGVDNELLVQDAGEQIVEMNNGCICCTVRGDLIRILGQLGERRDAGQLHFDRVLIETTGLADPAPVAQTFFVDDDVRKRYRLDGIVTMVDAKHAAQQLDEHHEAQEQVGFADRILISKTDVVADAEVVRLRQRLAQMNPRAPQKPILHGQAEVADVLDIKGFDLDAILKIEPGFLGDLSHEHDDDVGSFVFRSHRPFERNKLELFMDLLIRGFGKDLLRYKGVLSLKNEPERVIFQGVHMMLGASGGRPWGANEKRASTLVFIGRQLPKDQIINGLKACLTR